MHDYKIEYADLTSPMGEMIAGATEKGLCFLEWHDRGGVERILERVAKRYRTEPIRSGLDNPMLAHLQSELNQYFAGDRREFTLPIDITGTPFERLVWDKLRSIPCGETRSYGALAEEVGKPGGARAVGRANGANYLGIIIPCHRVIETSGGLGGYGGKLWRKKRLLEIEGSLETVPLFSRQAPG